MVFETYANSSVFQRIKQFLPKIQKIFGQKDPISNLESDVCQASRAAEIKSPNWNAQIVFITDFFTAHVELFPFVNVFPARFAAAVERYHHPLDPFHVRPFFLGHFRKQPGIVVRRVVFVQHFSFRHFCELTENPNKKKTNDFHEKIISYKVSTPTSCQTGRKSNYEIVIPQDRRDVNCSQ